jgi:hypothetical protein
VSEKSFGVKTEPEVLIASGESFGVRSVNQEVRKVTVESGKKFEMKTVPEKLLTAIGDSFGIKSKPAKKISSNSNVA